MRGSRATALVLSALLLATGCGIQASGVVEVGDAATAKVVPSDSDSTTLYLKGPAGLLPVVRPGVTRAAPGNALLLLLKGPTDSERAAGLTTELPNYYGSIVVNTNGDEIRVVIPRAVRDFSALARRQLVCTAAHAAQRGGRILVTVQGTDTTHGPEQCPF
ncbi:hypothetical protein ACFWXK_15180 [Streptomyces sp. NPDC059070]|uniref:hypothetical protein n=1 Tax=unclassified Streptomyces TaxID=2593676 RepID=UPI0034E2DBBA